MRDADRSLDVPPWVRRRLHWGEQVRHVGTFHRAAYDMVAVLTLVVAAVVVFGLTVDRGFVAVAILPGIPWLIVMAGAVANITARVVVTDARLLVAGAFGSDSYEVGEIFGAHVVQTSLARRLGYGRIDLYGLQRGENVRDLSWVPLTSVAYVSQPERAVSALIESAREKGFTVCDPSQPPPEDDEAAEQSASSGRREPLE